MLRVGVWLDKGQSAFNRHSVTEVDVCTEGSGKGRVNVLTVVGDNGGEIGRVCGNQHDKEEGYVDKGKVEENLQGIEHLYIGVAVVPFWR